MREIMYLTGYEYKKIFQKRSTWIALALVALWTVFSGISGIIGDYYVEGEKAGTRYQMVKKERVALEHPEIGELNEDFSGGNRKCRNYMRHMIIITCC